MRQLKQLGHITVKATEGKLFTCKSIWPLDLFPDTITLDEKKLTITHRTFFWSQQVITIQLPDLLNVEILAGPMVCTVRIYSKYVTGGQIDVEKIRKADGFKLRDIVNELMEEDQESEHGGSQ